MKHYLNTELKGKEGADGNVYYPVYIRFSVNSQTYKYKSQLVRRPLSLTEFQRLESMFLEQDSNLLQKEIDIVESIIIDSLDKGKFIQKKFKDRFFQQCRPIISILQEVNISMPISNWSKHLINWDLFSTPNLDMLDIDLVSTNGIERINHILLISMTAKFQVICAKSNDLDGLMLLFDWLNEDNKLKNKFFTFLNNELSKSERNQLHEHMRILQMI